MVFLYGNAVRVRNRLDSTGLGQIWAAAERAPARGYAACERALRAPARGRPRPAE